MEACEQQAEEVLQQGAVLASAKRIATAREKRGISSEEHGILTEPNEITLVSGEGFSRLPCMFREGGRGLLHRIGS